MDNGKVVMYRSNHVDTGCKLIKRYAIKWPPGHQGRTDKNRVEVVWVDDARQYNRAGKMRERVGV